jgi:hypothetical protein
MVKRPTKKTQSKIQKQKLGQRAQLWPDLDERRLWSYKNSDGWLNMPRSLPLILRIMDMLSSKGKPVSQTYLDLWCRTFEDSFVIASDPRAMAFYSGFTGERAESTWRTRMKLLAELGFIDIKAGASGPINYVLLYNPYHVIKRHHESGNVPEVAYNALVTRTLEIKATDLDDDPEDLAPEVTDKPRQRRKAAVSGQGAARDPG